MLPAARLRPLPARARTTTSGGSSRRRQEAPRYRAVAVVRWTLLAFGAATFQNSALSWSADHRAHHADTDRSGDPHPVTRGAWFAHMGWLFRRRRASADVTRLKDLWAVRSIRLQHRGYPAVAVGVGLVLPAFVAAQWGDPWGGLLVAGFLRAAAMLLDGAFEKCRVSEFGDRLAQDARVTALDETVNLKRLSRCHLDLLLGQARHERHTEGLELVRAVPYIEHSQVMSRTEAWVKSASRPITGSGRVQLLDDPVVRFGSHRRRRGQEYDSHHQPPRYQDGHILPHTMNGRLEEMSDAARMATTKSVAPRPRRPNGSTPSRWSTCRPSSCSRVHINSDRKPR